MEEVDVPSLRTALMPVTNELVGKESLPARGQYPLATRETLRGEPSAACGSVPR